MTSTAPMFFSDRTSSAALTVVFAGTEKKPTCFFISSNCFAVFVGLSIEIPPRFPLHSLGGLQADLPVRRSPATACTEQIRKCRETVLAGGTSTSLDHGCIFSLFAY